MTKYPGYSLIELVLSLGLFSILLTVFLKLNAWEQGRTQAILEEQNLMAYVDVLKWTLEREKCLENSIWSGVQNPKTRERKFIRGITQERFCWAEVNKCEEDKKSYRVVLHGENIKKTTPITFFIVKNS